MQVGAGCWETAGAGQSLAAAAAGSGRFPGLAVELCREYDCLARRAVCAQERAAAESELIHAPLGAMVGNDGAIGDIGCRRAAIAGPTATLIYDDWYPALRSEQLRGNKLHTAMLLDIPLVLGGARREDLCHARQLSASRDSAERGLVRRRARHLPLSRLGVRAVQRAVRAIPSLSSTTRWMPRASLLRRIPAWSGMGYAWVYIPSPGRGGARKLRTCRRCRSWRSSAREISYCASHRRPALQCGPRHHRADGPGARAVCASGLVVAFAGSRFARRPSGSSRFRRGFAWRRMRPAGNSAPYKLLGVYGEPVETTIDFVLPNRRWETIRCGTSGFQPDDGDSGDGFDLPDRCGGGVECLLPCAVCYADCEVLWGEVCAAGSADDDQQAEGLRHNPSLMLIDDADKPAKWYFALKQARLLDAAKAYGSAAVEAGSHQ
jgi:hypothetical protein